MPQSRLVTAWRQRGSAISGAVGPVRAALRRGKHARGVFAAGSETILGRVLIDQGAAARKRLQAELADLLATAADPQVFERRLFALAREAAVLDGVQLVRLVRGCLPKSARVLRAAGKRVLRHLHFAEASECDQAGYARAAAVHVVRGMSMAPRTFLRRRSIGILARYLIGSNARNRLLERHAASVFRLLNARRLRACIVGSLAISVHAQRFVKRHGDIDLVFRSEADTHRAATLLVDALECRIVRRHDWIGLTGERCFHVRLQAPSGIPIELSYLPENPRVKEQVRAVDGVRVRIADLRGLRNIYALFLLEKAAVSHDVERQSKKNAILTIDRLRSSKRRGDSRTGPVRRAGARNSRVERPQPMRRA